MSKSYRADPGRSPDARAREEDAGLGELLSRLTDQFGTLIRQEVALAKTEITVEVRRAGRAGGLFGAAAAFGYLALLLMLFAAAWGLAEVMPTWLAFLIVGAVVGIVAAVLATSGKKQADKLDPTPHETVETLKEDAQWAKNQRS